jgi:hypothetical protein
MHDPIQQHPPAPSPPDPYTSNVAQVVPDGTIQQQQVFPVVTPTPSLPFIIINCLGAYDAKTGGTINDKSRKFAIHCSLLASNNPTI